MVGELIKSGVFSQDQQAEHNNGAIAAQLEHEGEAERKSEGERVAADQGQTRLVEGDARNGW